MHEKETGAPGLRCSLQAILWSPAMICHHESAGLYWALKGNWGVCMKLDIIFTAPHPDDIEIGSGGTVAKLVKQGYKVGLIHLTIGEPTPRGTPETRTREMKAAGEVLGAHVVESL